MSKEEEFQALLAVLARDRKVTRLKDRVECPFCRSILSSLLERHVHMREWHGFDPEA